MFDINMILNPVASQVPNNEKSDNFLNANIFYLKFSHIYS